MPDGEVGSAFAVLGLDSKTFESSLNSAKSIVSSAAGDIEAKGKSMSESLMGSIKGIADVVAPLAGVFSAGFAVQSIISFQEQTYSLERAAQMTGETLKKVTDGVRDLSTNCDQSRDSLMQVATSLAAIDKTPDGIIKLTQSVADLAEVSGGTNTDLAALDEQIAKVWGEGVPGIEKLNNTVIGLKSALGADEATTLAFVGTWGKFLQSMGVTDTQAAALDATFQKMGADGDSLMSGLQKGMMTLDTKIGKLEETSQKVTAVTKKGGGEATAQAKIATEQLNDIQTAFGENSHQIESDLETDFSGTIVKLAARLKQHQGDLELTNAATRVFGAGTVKALIQIGDAQGVLTTATNVAGDAAGNQAEKEKLLGEVAKQLGDQIGVLVNIGKDIALTFGDAMSGALGVGMDAFIEFGRTIDQVLRGTKDAGTVIRDAFSSFNNLPGIEKVAIIAVGLTAILAAAGPVVAIFGMLAGSVLAFINPVTIAIVLAAAIGSAFVNWADVGKKAADAISRLTTFVSGLATKLKSGDFKGAFNDIANAAKNLASDVYNYFAHIDFRAALQTGIDALKSWIGKAIDFGSSILASIENIDWSGVASTVLAGLKTAFDTLKGVGKSIYDAIVSVDWSGIGTKILDGVKSIPDQIQKLFSGIDFGKMWDTLTTSVSGAADSIFTTLNNIKWGDIGYQAGKALSEAISNAITTLSDIGTKIGDYLKTASANAGTIGSDIGEKIKSGLATISGWMDQAKTGFLIGWEDTGKKIGEFIKTAIASITDYGTAIANTIYTNLKTWVDNNLGNLSQIGKDIGADFVKGIVAWIMVDAKIWASLWNLLTNAPKWLAIGVEAIGTLIQGMVQGGLDTLADLFSVAILTGAKAAVDLINPVLAKIGQHIDTTEIDTKLASLKTALTSLGDTHVDAKVGVATTYTGGSDPSTLEGRNFDATLTVKTYLNQAGENINAPVISQAGTRVGYVPGTSGASTALEIGPKSLSEIAKGMAGQGADASQIRDAIVNAIKEENDVRKTESRPPIELSNNVVQKNIEDAIKAAQPSIDAYAFTHKKIDDASTAATNENIALEKGATKENVAAIKDVTLKFKEGVGGAATGFFDTVVAGAVAGAKAASAPIVDAGLTFRQQIWQAVSDTDATWRSANEAVKIGFDENGRNIAVIGQVAQQQFQAAGGKWVGDTSNAGVSFGAKIGGVGDQLVSKIGTVGSQFTSQMGIASNQLTNTFTSIGNFFGTTVNGAATNLNAAAMNFMSAAASISARNFFGPATTPAAASSGTPASGVSHTPATGGSSFDDPWMQNIGTGTGHTATTFLADSAPKVITKENLDQLPCAATGTMTTGPQFAMIGEDGPAHPEFVIPTKTKRWDLLYAAMRAYGIPGYAEGTATGTAGAAEGDAPPLSATFGISGLASMSNGVQKIINDLKDFFRISWGIIKSEASTYWKSIEKVITDEVTIVRDAAWQGALDIRNTWISSDAAILADATASYAALWPAISPSIASVHDGIISSFTDSESQVKSIMDQMASDAMTSLSSFQVSWTTVWQQLLADLSSTSSQITSFLQGIAAQVGNISVNISMGAGGGGGSGGGDGGGSWMSDAGNGGTASTYDSNGQMTVNTNGTANFTDLTCMGDTVLVNALKYTNPNGVVNYINPMTYIGNGGISNYQGSSSNAGGSNPSAGSSAPVYGNSGVSAPGGSISSFFSADGGVFDKPAVTHVAEKGVEMVLPTKLSRMFLSLADAGLGQGAAGGAKIVIEDHTEHHWYMDNREVTNLIMKGVQKKIQLRGGVSAV
jgi:hypothetical protein